MSTEENGRSRIILVAETGSDIPPALAEKYNIYIVPMHVTFGDKTLDDGAFPPEDVCAWYDRTGTLPKTSGCSPEDFERVFSAIHAEHPQAQILYLAYSAVTTVSYQSALIAAEELDFVTGLDTGHVSVGQAAVVLSVAEYLKWHPDATVEQAVDVAKYYADHARMGFIPDDLEYLRAGGRISNAAYYLGGQFLHLHPLVEILDGKLVATKKYRGKIEKVVERLIREYTEDNRLKKDRLWLLSTPGLSEEVRQTAEKTAKDCGFSEVIWLKAGCVITTHGGPGAIAVAGFAR